MMSNFVLRISDSVDILLPFVLYQVVLLTALIISAAAAAAGGVEAFQLSMYLRVLVPVVFTRYYFDLILFCVA